MPDQNESQDSPLDQGVDSLLKQVEKAIAIGKNASLLDDNALGAILGLGAGISTAAVAIHYWNLIGLVSGFMVFGLAVFGLATGTLMMNVVSGRSKRERELREAETQNQKELARAKMRTAIMEEREKQYLIDSRIVDSINTARPTEAQQALRDVYIAEKKFDEARFNQDINKRYTAINAKLENINKLNP